MKHQTRLITASLSTLFLLVGCQSKEEYTEKMRSTWKGQSESALLAKRKTPNRFFESDGIRYLTYISSSSHRTPINCSAGPSNSSVSCIGDKSVNLFCEETFKIKDGIILGGTSKGNDCY